MAYNSGVMPTDFNFNATTTPPPDTRTGWEKFVDFMSVPKNLGNYVIIPIFAVFLGSCILIYGVHIFNVWRRKQRRLKRLRLNSLKISQPDTAGKEWLIPPKSDSSADELDHVSEPYNKTPASAYPQSARLKSKVQPLVYHGSQADRSVQNSTVTLQKNGMVTPPRTISSSTLTLTRSTIIRPSTQSRSIMTRPNTVTKSVPSENKSTKKQMMSISTKCNCESTIHRPGCKHFSLPAVKKQEGSVTVDDVNMAMKDAMDRVIQYENELKTNPEMQEVLLKYRQRKEQEKEKNVKYNMDKGDWQNVPIAKLLERKRQYRRQQIKKMKNIP